MAGRLLIIGLDAGTYDILDPLIASGQMPEVGAILSSSARAELLSTFPPTTSPAWPALATGLEPGKLGFFGLLNRRPGTQYDFRVAKNTFDRRSLWSIAGHAGLATVVCGVPATFPPVESPNVTVVTGMLTPNGQPRTVPPGIEAALEREGLIIDWEELRDLEGSVRLPDEEARLALHLLDTIDWKVFLTVFRSSDGIFHTHPRELEAHAEMFRRIDRHIGAMRGRLDPHDTLMLVSDHGMTRLGETVHVNSLLQREGLLVKRTRAASVDERALGVMESIKNLPLFHNPIIKSPLARRLAERVRQRAFRRRLEYGREGRRQPRLSEALIDWGASTCFFVDLGYGSGVYLNLRGREPLGIVDTGAYAATRDTVMRMLSREEGIVVRRREDVYAGPYVERAPDLLVSTAREDLGLSGRMLDMPVRTPVDVPYFHHTRRGIWSVMGPGVRARFLSEALGIADVCPTSLHLLGLGVPSDSDGKVRHELFDRDSEPARRAIEYVDPVGEIGTDDLDEYDEEAIKEKLRGLGYMH